MQLTSILMVSTTLLAAQVPAQFIRSMIPNVPAWSGVAVPSSMETPTPSSSMPVASKPSHYMASHSFRPAVHPPIRVQASSSMLPVARPSSQSMVPLAIPSSSSSYQAPNQHQGLRMPAAQNSDQTYAIPDGGIAPVDPLQPSSDVAPVLIQKPSGVDEGNSFCMGSATLERRRHTVRSHMLRLCISQQRIAGCAASSW